MRCITDAADHAFSNAAWFTCIEWSAGLVACCSLEKLSYSRIHSSSNYYKHIITTNRNTYSAERVAFEAALVVADKTFPMDFQMELTVAVAVVDVGQSALLVFDPGRLAGHQVWRRVALTD